MDAKQFRDITLAAKAVQVSVTVPSTAAAAAGDVTVTVPGVQLGDIVHGAAVGSAIPAKVLVTFAVTAANTVTVNVWNESGATFNPGAVLYNFVVLRPKTA